ncbi:MAG: hypothetical protein HY565_03685 [Candidatus Kerfeldbacteria bacterium]|nr:hypothetical protein [Candidatus Kerfeldbacteria bacterium]
MPDKELPVRLPVESLEVRGGADAQLTRVIPQPANVQQGFTVELPQHIAEIDETASRGTAATERSNQRRLFAIREYIAAQPGGAEFTWLPQAIEAFLRSQRSDFLPAIGRARAISIRPDLGVVTFVTQNEEGVLAPFDLRMADLKPYSLELIIAGAEAKQELPPITYSAEMVAARDTLSPDAKHRWDLITQAARVSNDTIVVKPVTSDVMFGGAEGVGVFVHNDRPAASRWSLAKVTADDIPFTNQEQALLQQAEVVYDPARFDPTLHAFWDVVCKITDELKGTHGIGLDHEDTWRDRVAQSWKKVTGSDPTYVAAVELRDLITHYLRCGDARLTLRDAAYKVIMQGKSTYREVNPFETTVWPQELRVQMEQELNTSAELFAKLNAILFEKRGAIIALLETNTAKQDTTQAYGTKRAATLHDLAEQLSTMSVELPDNVRGLLK